MTITITITIGRRPMLREYLASQRIAVNIYPHLLGSNEFYALLMTAARFADSGNLERLEQAFPGVMAELKARYNAPGGALDDAEMEFVRSV